MKRILLLCSFAALASSAFADVEPIRVPPLSKPEPENAEPATPSRAPDSTPATTTDAPAKKPAKGHSHKKGTPKHHGNSKPEHPSNQ